MPAAGSDSDSSEFASSDFGVLSSAAETDVVPEFADGVTTVEGEFGTVTVNLAVAFCPRESVTTYVTDDDPVKPSTGVNVIAPDVASTAKAPSPGTDICITALLFASKRRTSDGSSATPELEVSSPNTLNVTGVLKGVVVSLFVATGGRQLAPCGVKKI